MRKTHLFQVIILTILIIFPCRFFAATPDSAYVFAYSTSINRGSNGLHFAWSTDRKNWHAIGPELRYLFCDYGRWGSEKRMVNPYLFQDKNQRWHCVWSVNEYDKVFAHAYSDDLIYWYPQTYPQVSPGSCLMPEIHFNPRNQSFDITWITKEGENQQVYGNSTNDFKTYSTTQKLSEKSRINLREQISVSGNVQTGTVHKVKWGVIDQLLSQNKLREFQSLQENESYRDDAARFSGLKPVDVQLKINTNERKKISDLLMGIFFEDINYAADGGLYAELIQNRGFEYQLSDKDGRDKGWNAAKAWTLQGESAEFLIDTILPVHQNNPHYAVLKVAQPGAILQNEGFNGIVIKAGEKYDFSMFARMSENKSGQMIIQLKDKTGKVIGQSNLKFSGTKWKKVSSVIKVNQSSNEATLNLIPQQTGNYHLDMISLFPQKTFKNRKNGLRNDLAQTIADLHPRFVRFPGGCVAHGNGIGNIYHWKNTIGPLESRKPQRNLWGYHQSAGLGYFEYFRFCEDIGAEPVPVVAAGVPCQNSHVGGAGQQGGIPMCDMRDYVQDVLDLIEYANGDAKSVWGKKRADAGHPKPFNLKYIGIGNEDLINDIFEERFTLIYKAVKEKYPEITVIGTVGPFWEGTDYIEGWKIADKLNLAMVDEHYYNSPGWFINHNDYYDSYDRSKSKVYLGEWASKGNNVYNALVEAHYLTALERNGDVVSMASYAPLLAKEGFTQWNPDLIYFNNAEVKPTVNYFVQQLFGEHTGNSYISNNITLSGYQDKNVTKRISSSVVFDTLTGDYIIKLVNLLPVSINTNISLNDLTGYNPEAFKIVLTGNPSEKTARPQKGSITISNNFTCEQPAYSFTLIRIKKNIKQP